MGKALIIAKGIFRLVMTVLLCVALAAIGYGMIIGCIMLFPPPAIQ
jgi:hypothetical protein